MAQRRSDVARGKRLRELRRKAGLTQAQLAQKVGAHPAFISNAEHGRTSPGRELLFKLAKALDTSSEFIETGQATDLEGADDDLRLVAPELAYLFTHQIALPLLRNPTTFFTRGSPFERLVVAACNAIHYCDLREWLAQPEGDSLLRELEGFSLTTILRNAMGQAEPFIFTPSPRQLATDTFHRRNLRPRADKHTSPWSKHDRGKAVDCFAFDLEIAELGFARFFATVRAECYWETSFNDEFVHQAFPVLLWSAAQIWPDRRLAAWFWYLGLRAELFGPLVRLARQYDSAQQFAASSARFMSDASTGECDRFLGYFRCLYGVGYFALPTIGFKAHPVAYSSVSFNQNPHGLRPVLQRSVHRETILSKALIDFIFYNGTDEQKRRVIQLLTAEAPQHEIADSGRAITVSPQPPPGDAPFPDHPRALESPPETLP